MTSHYTQGKLIIQNENLDLHIKKAADDGKTKNFKTSTKKGGVGFGTRKALNDITNKSSVHHEASSRKKNLPKEDFDIAEEMFLHDHKKCFEAQQAAMKPCFLDTVLPGHGSIAPAQPPECTSTEAEVNSPRFQLPEIPMSEFSDWLQSSTCWISPSSSPTHWDSPPVSPFSLQFEAVEFLLK